MQIYITGCARTGTTLLNRLFYAFDDMSVHDVEISLHDYINASGWATEHVCAKRSVDSLFSNFLPPEEEQFQAGLVGHNDITIINIVRDGRDVCHKPDKGTVATPARWMASMNQMERSGNLIAYTVYYEDLVTIPDVVQNDLADSLGLVSEYRWSDYPNFVPAKGFSAPSTQGLENYGKRAIEPSRHDKNEWKNYLDRQYHDAFENYLKKYEKRAF